MPAFVCVAPGAAARAARRRRLRLGWGRLLAPLLALLAATPAAAQPRVRLELRPLAGDTLRMVVEQHTELRGSAREGSTPHVVTSRMRMTSRTIVVARQARSSSLISITDTVEISTSDPHGQAMAQDLVRQLQGRTLRMHLAPDGTARVISEATPGRAPDQVAELVAAMPAAFPANPVAVGERWTRELAIPGAGGRRTPGDGGVFRATFRLDSLSADQSLAYISIRGEIGRDAGAGSGRGEMRGTLTGTMLLDRARGWLADSRTVVMLHTTLAAGAAGGEPMRFITSITQHVRTLTAPER